MNQSKSLHLVGFQHCFFHALGLQCIKLSWKLMKQISALWESGLRLQ